MSRIIVDEYPCEPCECPMSRYIANGFDGHYSCACSQELCVLDDEYLEDSSDFIEEYGFNRQAYCKDYCRYLQDFDSIFTTRS